jgi:transcriptional regulator with GAF, ATPase, and Fis domain
MRHLFALLERVAPSDASILIEGETGTGKSMLAESIHAVSPRAKMPFITVDCASLPRNLLESELFGHERGAFTGAVDNRVGLFETANGGTILLDEIGELPVDLQPKLLRALERRVIRRVGSSRAQPINIRVIAATNRDLRAAVNAGTFRSDLWYRLNTVRVVLPPLRDRREDIPMLVAAVYRELTGDPKAMPPADVVRPMMREAWAGNVRELRTAVERMLIGAPTASADPVVEFEQGLPFRTAKTRASSQWERRYLSELLIAHDGNVSAAARAGKMNRSHLSELLHRHGLASIADDVLFCDPNEDTPRR